MNAPTLTRRSFTKGLGGMVLTCSLDPAELLAQGVAARLPGSLNNNRSLQAWIRIGGDGNATVYDGSRGYGHTIWTANPPPSFVIELAEPSEIDCIRFLLWDMEENRY
jgi:hypothetical protein